MSDKDLLADAKEAFRLAAESESDQRTQSLEDIRFARLGEQWPLAVKRQREIEGRPCLTLNRLPAFGKQVINDARQNRPAIKCHPVGSGADKETAEILNGLIRNIEYTSNADVAYDTGIENAVYGGRGYFLIRTDYASDDSFDIDLKIEPVWNPFSVYGDPSKPGADSADWNSSFVTDMITREEYKSRWPDADIADFDNARDQTDAMWFDGDKVMIAEWWKREQVPGLLVKLSDGQIMREEAYLQIKPVLDAQLPPVTVVGSRQMKTHKVTQHIVSGAEILETNPWRGRFIPVVPVYGEMVNVEGKWYYQGLFHFAKDSQRQYNFWSTTSTELMAMQPKAPFIVAEGQVENDKNWETANSISHPYLKYTPVEGAPPPERQPSASPALGAIQEAMRASDDMKSIIGIHDASLGAVSNETSGRAILARQREGDVSTFNFTDNLSRAIRHTGRILVDLIPEHYDAARIIRCIKEDGSNYSMPINQPVIPAQQAAQAAQSPQGSPQYVAAPPEAAMDPRLQAITRVFDLSVGKYDVTVEAGPSFTTRREEAANQMLEFIRVLPGAAPLIGDLLAKHLDWPSADEIAGRLQAMLPAQVQGQNPAVGQLQQQLQTQDAQAKDAVAKLTQRINELQLQLKDKQSQEQIDQYEAVNGRITALANAYKAGVQLTQNAEGDLQAIPLMKPMDQDQAVDANLRAREQSLEAADLTLRAGAQRLDAHRLASDHVLGHMAAVTDRLQALRPQQPQPPQPQPGM